MHYFCLAVEAGFYSGVVECLPVDPVTLVQSWLGQVKCFRPTTNRYCIVDEHSHIHPICSCCSLPVKSYGYYAVNVEVVHVATLR